MAGAFDELNSLAEDLGKAGAFATLRAIKAVGKSAERIEKMGKKLATGTSIAPTITREHDLLTAEIGPELWWAHFVELGNQYVGPRAFMGPALDREGPEFVKGLADATDPFGGR